MKSSKPLSLLSSLLTALGGVGIVMSMKQEKLGGSGNWPGA